MREVQFHAAFGIPEWISVRYFLLADFKIVVFEYITEGSGDCIYIQGTGSLRAYAPGQT